MQEANNTTTPSWPELLGSTNWTDLLSPLSLPLRNLILLCGDFCQVTYDAFNNDQHSKYCGASRYGKRNLLTRTCFPFSNDYSVSQFIYATSKLDLPAAFLFSHSREAWSKESNWIGYIAVSSDKSSLQSGRRDIYIAWRGTIRDLEWADVFQPELISIEPILSKGQDYEEERGDVKVMKGWYTIYTSTDPKSPFNKKSARDQLLSRIKYLVDLYKDEKLSIICVGHSLGASLSVLSAFDIVENGLSKLGEKERFPVCAVVFGSPQIGNKEFNERIKKLPNLKVLHVKNKIDLIPLYPTGLLGYVYTGVDLIVDARKSPYIKDSKNPSDWHNLQGILHGVAGWNGEDGRFEMKVERSVALVNKSSEYLKDECLIPGSWWIEKNKGMVLGDDGEWKLGPLDEDDVPNPPSDDHGVENDVGSEFAVSSPMKKKKSSRNGVNKLVSCFRGNVN